MVRIKRGDEAATPRALRITVFSLRAISSIFAGKARDYSHEQINSDERVIIAFPRRRRIDRLGAK
jgi:hypothetical protein